MAQDAKVAVLGNDGAMHAQAALTVDTKRISNFVEAYRKEYFEAHSLDWCLDTIIERGIAEIKRYVKTNAERKKQQAAGAMVKEFGLTEAQARELLKAALEQQKIAKAS